MLQSGPANRPNAIVDFRQLCSEGNGDLRESAIRSQICCSSRRMPATCWSRGSVPLAGIAAGSLRRRDDQIDICCPEGPAGFTHLPRDGSSSGVLGFPPTKRRPANAKTPRSPNRSPSAAELAPSTSAPSPTSAYSNRSDCDRPSECARTHSSADRPGRERHPIAVHRALVARGVL